jgi:hypothetical protein
MTDTERAVRAAHFESDGVFDILGRTAFYCLTETRNFFFSLPFVFDPAMLTW